MYLMLMIYSPADALSLGNWFTVFKVLTLNVAMLTMFLYQSNFGSIPDFSNTMAKAIPFFTLAKGDAVGT